MVAAPSPPPNESIWESLLPGITSGMSERERVRMANMYLPHEPLPQEAIGLSLLLGAISARIGGLFGLLMGKLDALSASGPRAGVAYPPARAAARRRCIEPGPVRHPRARRRR